MSSGLSVLPGEILNIVLSCCPKVDLLSLARVSKQLNRIIAAHIYSYVYFSGNVHSLYEQQNFERWRHTFHLDGPETTRIYNFEQFHRTIKANPYLRSLVICAGFQNKTHQETGRSHLYSNQQVPSSPWPDKASITNLLRLIAPSLRSLWISGFEQLHDISTGDFKLTTIGFDQGTFYNDIGDPISDELEDIDYVHSLFLLPTLKNFTYEGVRCWWRPDALLAGQRKSQVKSLEFTFTVPAGDNPHLEMYMPLDREQYGGNGMAHVLGWIESLEKITVEIAPGPTLSSFPGGSSELSPLSLYKDLSIHRASLTEICVSVDIGPGSDDGSKMGAFSDFPHLRRLALPYVFLRDPDKKYYHSLQSLWQLLPPRLEEFLLETSDENSETFPLTGDFSWMEEGELSERDIAQAELVDIAAHKAKFPHFKNIIIWNSGNLPSELKDGAWDHTKYFAPVKFDFKTTDQWNNVLSELNAVNICLEIWQADDRGNHVPLYDHFRSKN